MIEIDGSVFFQIANFLIMMIAMNYLLYRPIRGILKERREKIQGYETEISGLSGQVEERLQAIEEEMTAARKDGFDRKDALKSEGMDEEKRIISAAAAEVETEHQHIQERIKDEIGSAREALMSDLDLFSKELAQKLLGRSLV